MGGGGEQINTLQSETGAHIQVAPGNDACAYPLQITGNEKIVMLTWAIIVGKAVLSFTEANNQNTGKLILL